jgi:hypothetical protein
MCSPIFLMVSLKEMVFDLVLGGKWGNTSIGNGGHDRLERIPIHWAHP